MEDMLEFFIDEMLDHAVSGYHSTEEYRLMQENLTRMNRDCEVMFTEDQLEYAQECFTLLLDASGRQEKYIYRRGILDCVQLLKGLQILV